MKTHRAELPTTTTARPANQDRERARQRMELVARLYVDERLTLDQIVDRLAKQNFIASRSTVSRDLDRMRRENRRLFNPRRFDAVSFVLERIAVYEALIRKTIRDAHHTRDVRARVLAYRTAADVNEKITNLLADSGFIDRRIGTLVIDDETPTSPIPNGVELAERWANLVVPDLCPEAERAWKFGDQAMATAAAEAATVGTSNRNNNGDRNEQGEPQWKDSVAARLAESSDRRFS